VCFRGCADGLTRAPAQGIKTDSSQDIRDRAFTFACDVAQAALALPVRPGIRCIVDQLLKSGTAIGSNLEEAKAGSSRREFVRLVKISLREARESVYWLRICLALGLGARVELERLRGEGEQIARILGAIVVKTKAATAAGYAVFAFCILTFAFAMLLLTS
jgi:four helix bundle protein